MGRNLETIRDAYDAFANGDIPTVLAAMDPQIDWREPESMPFDSQLGPDAVLQNIFAVLPTVFNDFSLEVLELIDAGDVVLSVGVYHAVGKATGETLRADFAHVWRFGADGKINGFRTYTDTHLWRKVLDVDDREAQPSGSPA
jgi:uncharacterized protein